MPTVFHAGEAMTKFATADTPMVDEGT